MLSTIHSVSAFTTAAAFPFAHRLSCSASGLFMSTEASAPATLTKDTTWRIRLVLKNVATESGKKLEELLVNIDGCFIEEEGYEPPQGSFEQSDTTDDQLRILQCRWQLSEDPEDRKDGLWVWGLFKEPLYPFMLLRLQTEPLKLQDDTVPSLSLYAQIPHQRKDGQVFLGSTDVNIREMETIKADPFGAAKVDIYEEVSVGSINFQIA